MSRETEKRARRVVKSLQPKIAGVGASEMILPNHSGDHVRSIKRAAPVNDVDLTNKIYVDTVLAGLITGYLDDHPHQDVRTTAGPSFDGTIFANFVGTGIDVMHSVTIGNFLSVGDDLTVDGDATIGDGSGSPTLEIHKDPTGVGKIKFGHDFGGAIQDGWDIYQAADEQFYIEGIRVNENLNLRVNQNGTPKTLFSLDATNNYVVMNGTGTKVGIGTSTPSGNLHVEGEANENTEIGIHADAGEFPQLRFYQDATLKGSISYDLGSNNIRLINNFDTGDILLRTRSNQTRLTIKRLGEIQINGGDLVCIGDGSGLPYGGMYGNNIGWTSVAFGGGGTFVIINTLSGGEVNETTFQNTQELLIAKAGRYLINWSCSVEALGADKHAEAGIGVNGTVNIAGREHIHIGSANKEDSMSGTAILDLAATNTIALMITNVDDDTQLTVEHASLTVVHIGGT